MNRTDFQKLSRLRLQEAKLLLQAQSYSGAYYLAGYSVECALKACIAKETARYDFPDKDRVQKSYTHNLTELLSVSGLKVSFADAQITNANLASSWSVVANWSEKSRYQFFTLPDAQSMIEAVAKRKDGVLSWITQRW
jgi:HEPN domain-containing protein